LGGLYLLWAFPSSSFHRQRRSAPTLEHLRPGSCCHCLLIPAIESQVGDAWCPLENQDLRCFIQWPPFCWPGVLVCHGAEPLQGTVVCHAQVLRNAPPTPKLACNAFVRQRVEIPSRLRRPRWISSFKMPCCVASTPLCWVPCVAHSAEAHDLASDPPRLRPAACLATLASRALLLDGLQMLMGEQFDWRCVSRL
jgi:hypothetical protein